MHEPRPRSPRLRSASSLLLATFLGIVLAASPAAAQGPRPNVVLIVADDMGFADVGFNGSTDTRTPNLDKLAASGVKLDQFYVQPLCSPTRAALMTGRYPMRHGLQVGVVRPWAKHGLPLEERTLAQALKDVGYETAITGKWHLGHFEPEYLPTRRGFDHQYGHYNGQIDYNTHERDGGFDWHRDDKVNRDEGYSTHLIAAEAVKRIKERDANKPLFLYVPFNAVHSPHQVPEKYKEPYASLPEPRRTYAGMLAAMDEGIGQIIGAIEEAKIRENTLVIFTSDNGGADPGRVTSNGPLRGGKGGLFEGGVRVAACAAWPGTIAPGGTVSQPLHAVDVFPTVLKLAGGDISDASKQKLPVDGIDAADAVVNGTKIERAILLNATPVNGAIRVGDWKLVVGAVRAAANAESGDAGAAADADDDGDDAGAPAAGKKGKGKGKGKGKKAKAESRAAQQAAAAEAGADGKGIPANAPALLFNLANDPGEKQDLAAQNPEKVKALRAAYDKLAVQAIPPKVRDKPADFATPAVWGE